ncbi:MAG: ABC transporter ATP-binding protein [Candidatus Dormibacteria bacterium]
MAEPLTPVRLELRSLTKRYGEITAVEEATVSIGGSEIVAVVGPNGAGKTTLLSLIAGWTEPTAGTVLVEGHPPSSIEARRVLSYAPDTPVFYGDLSVMEHVDFVGAMHGVDPGVGGGQDLLGRLGLLDRADSYPSQLSRGMRQKLSLVLALVRPFRLLLLDEPFANLDAASVDELLGIMAEARRAGATILVVSHQDALKDVRTRTLTVDAGLFDLSARRPARARSVRPAAQ